MSSDAVLESQLRVCYGRVVYSHKTHEKCADILLYRLSIIKWSQIALSVLTTGSLIAVLFGTGTYATILGSVSSALLLTLNTYTKDYDLGKMSQQHRQSAAELWLVREKYLSLLVDLRTGQKSITEIRSRRDVLLSELYGVYSGSPGTSVRGYKRAQRGLQEMEEMTFSDEEIDGLLPGELGRTDSRL